MEIWKKSLKELSELIKSKELKPSEVVEAFIERKIRLRIKLRLMLQLQMRLLLKMQRKRMKRF